MEEMDNYKPLNRPKTAGSALQETRRSRDRPSHSAVNRSYCPQCGQSPRRTPNQAAWRYLDLKQLRNGQANNYIMYTTYSEPRGVCNMQKRVPMQKEYVHDQSTFYATQPAFRRHFVIHPDWVSERITPRPISARVLKKKNGLKYGSRYGV